MEEEKDILITKLTTIKTQKDNNLKPENLRKGISLLGIEGELEEGVDTSDATAEASNILVDKSAYVNGEKIEGTMANNGELNIIPSREDQLIPEGYTEGGIIEGDDDLKAYNIRANVSIFEVEGSAPTTFSTIEEMEADTNYKEGTIAVVAGTVYQGTYKLENGEWVAIDETTDTDNIMAILNETANTDDPYDGEGGTDQEISNVLDAIMDSISTEIVIPANYQELEYIGCNGTQALNTLLQGNGNYKIEVKFQVTSPSTGSRVNDIFFDTFGNYQLTWYNNRWYYGTGPEEKNLISTQASDLQVVIFNNDNNRLSFNGVEYGESYTQIDTTAMIKISNNTSSGRNSYARYYYITITDKNTNKIVRNMIPVKRNEDNVVCMYDKITKQYFENIGTGEFIEGPAKTE